MPVQVMSSFLPSFLRGDFLFWRLLGHRSTHNFDSISQGILVVLIVHEYTFSGGCHVLDMQMRRKRQNQDVQETRSQTEIYPVQSWSMELPRSLSPDQSPSTG